MDNIRNLLRNWYTIPKGILRLCFILLNNVYCIPTYVIWMFLLSPLRKVNPDIYWRIEGYFFHWLLAMVSLWSYSAGYDIVEVGDDITECLDDRTLIIANHQSTADVPLLFACFNPKKQVLPNIMWIMDSLFKYTNFGVVSVLHKDFFIMSGKDKRDKSLQALAQHILDAYLPLGRKWLVLFPEGGFLRKRKAISHRYAEKMNLPKFENVSLPRVGAMQIIMNMLGPKSALNNNCNSVNNQVAVCTKIQWVLDITIAYPNGWPIDLSHIVFGHRDPCQTVIFYRLYSFSEVPDDSDTMTKWLIKRWEEKEKMLEHFYKTGEFSSEFCHNEMCPPKVVLQDYLRFLILHVFFIASTYIHIQMFAAVYNYYNYLVY
ncbi:acyl-CoA:lysophosphatidylglycerol acyltransferase 1 [Anoplophora glabripennis]|uniref:Acyl-CoA:lysophosphatidylglycerol acyltransferase n=1 Tax=Anoplophora glabripennis TaxID=217634 RepID=V5GRN4_ANOGL|nr:acyl-CoA:lysophosphatidylglycerol acyltransferase 1 [Anoplophora glabripennis]XP_018572649.1 acyl-CoA:lysophosphatidylglycerol acyltransferase 1 [Anoplophora glabripennis]